MVSVICERVKGSTMRKVGTGMMIGGPLMTAGSFAAKIADDHETESEKANRRLVAHAGIPTLIVGSALRRAGKFREAGVTKRKKKEGR